VQQPEFWTKEEIKACEQKDMIAWVVLQRKIKRKEVVVVDNSYQSKKGEKQVI
jgi:hypothetical protein